MVTGDWMVNKTIYGNDGDGVGEGKVLLLQLGNEVTLMHVRSD